MKKLKLVALAIIGIAFVSMVSCKKGDTGPAGAAGATGPAGPDSVLYSSWTTLAMTDEGQDTSSGLEVYDQNITASAITQTVLDNGIIVGYLSFVDNNGNTNVVNASPYFNPELFTVGAVYLASEGSDWSGYNYRYVIIPGTIAVGNSILKGYSKEQIKAIDYNTLTKALNLSTSKASSN